MLRAKENPRKSEGELRAQAGAITAGAMTETLAHLRYLEQRGTVRRSGAGQALRWQAA